MSYQSISCPDPMWEAQNQYDAGWWDGVEYGLTMRDINNDILPEENQAVLLFINSIYIPATFKTLMFQENGQQYHQKMFVTYEGRQFLPGYVRWWMPLPIIPV